ncbi:ribosome silencing factor [Candidatus Paracaedibacter symbiosus]|uniref:ribosome silencing factor n=1 Tax=Candidatus Paracaedibacter symbiosus TaxID=244582 RepID=UPI000509E0CC|nr:ribosome silencing factor [Candidatus Paracaedibacter symbiosus]
MLEKTTPLDVDAIYEEIIKLLDEKKAENIVTIDLRNKSSIADKLIIASGTSTRQVGAIAEGIHRELKKLGVKSSIEGIPQCDWVLVDAGDIIVHVFRPEVRAFYNLEKMWGAEIPQSQAFV